MRVLGFASVILLGLAACGDDGGRSDPDAGERPGSFDAQFDGGNEQCRGADCTDLYVAAGGKGDTCTMAAPCGSIQKALDIRTADRNVIHVAPGSYTESVVITGGKPVTILGEGADVKASGDTSTVVVRGDLAVKLVGLDIHGAKGDVIDPTEAKGIYCVIDGRAEPKLTLERVTLRDNPGHGLKTSRCTISIERSMIRNNGLGGIAMYGDAFTVRNTFIVDNGTRGELGSTGGFDIVVAPEPSGVFEFNTVANNHSGTAPASGVYAGDSKARFSSNLIVGNHSDLMNVGEVFGGTWDHTLLTGNKLPPSNPQSNALITDAMFKGGSDYHLVAGSPAIDKGGASAEVTVDYDGDARPAGNGRDIGADELP